MRFRFQGSAVALVLALAACGQALSPHGSASFSAVPTVASRMPTPIKHIVVIIQENRSFDNIFAGFPGADAPTTGLMHSTTSSPDPVVPLHEIRLEDSHRGGPPHGWSDAIRDWDGGKMDGFNIGILDPTALYAYLNHQEVEPYWEMARQYVLADHMFPREFGPSFTAHLDLIAGTTFVNPEAAVVNVPHQTDAVVGWGCDAPATANTFVVDPQRVVAETGPFPCFTQFRTMADTLDAAKVTWKFYAPALAQPGFIWSAFQSIANVYHGPDWTNNVISPQTMVIADASTNRLPSVAWVVPDAKDSDHPATHSNTGPSWVASVVNEIGRSKDWNSTVIVILWDEWGGWYDDVSPPQPDFVGLGIRVPCIIISPYAKQGYVSHTQYEYGSILKFMEETFDLPPLGKTADGYSDTRATSLSDALDFTQAPRRFRSFRVPYPPAYFLRRPPSLMAPDND